MMSLKTCSICKLLLSLECFQKLARSKDGVRSECKNCRKKQREANLQEYKLQDQKSRNKNKEQRCERSKKYYYDHVTEKHEYDQQYYLQNKSKIIEQHNIRSKFRRTIDVGFRLRHLISVKIGQSLKNNNSFKDGKSCLRHLTYTMQELKEYLEKQFEPWMNWDNHGKYNSKMWDDNNSSTWTWQIDHIIPQSDLPYISMNDLSFKRCWALSNLRPLSAKQNLLDGLNRTRHIKQ